ncbi:MAG: hypothetical protein PHQ59_04235 [Candidatus Daviesbacteria bacterium]|nr:hypothetical protein [Candidatus Daviesbacteria bacterium]
MINLETHRKYDQGKIANLFQERGWPVIFTDARNIDMMVPHIGSPVLCIDGKNANREESKKIEGIKLPGGVDFVAALKTGGCPVGFNAAAGELARLGYRAGTHKKCSFYELWKNGLLEFAKYPLVLPKFNSEASEQDNLGRWISLKIRQWGGEHFHLPGEHTERKVRLNPFFGITPVSQSDYFSFDLWPAQLLDISDSDSINLLAETVEKINRECMVVEILTHKPH